MSCDPLSLAEAHALLGLSPDAGSGEALAAFRAAVKRTHPDLGGDAEALRQVVAAYRLLTEPATTVGPVLAMPDGGFVEIDAFTALAGGEAEAVLPGGRRQRLRIPAGARSGEVLRAGFERVTVKLAPGGPLQVRGSDLWLSVRLTGFLLNDGGRAEVETPLGAKTLWISRAAAGRRLVRLAGEGLPARPPYPQGNLFIRLEPEEGAPDGPARAQLKRFAAAWAA